MIEIHHRILEKISHHAKKNFPKECCGILIGRNQGGRSVEVLFETENAEIRRSRDRYIIDGKDFLDADNLAERKGSEIIGFYHSHPGNSCIPSSRDKELAWQGYSYLIVSLKAGKEPEFRSWIMEETGKGFIEEKIYETGNCEG